AGGGWSGGRGHLCCWRYNAEEEAAPLMSFGPDSTIHPHHQLRERERERGREGEREGEGEREKGREKKKGREREEVVETENRRDIRESRAPHHPWAHSGFRPLLG